MADYWNDRAERILNRTEPYAVAAVTSPTVSPLHVQGELICSTAAATQLGLAQRRQFELKRDAQAWLGETDLGLWTYSGRRAIPELALLLRRVADDQRIAPHYIFSGEAKPTVPRGGPAGPPAPRAPVALPTDWTGDGVTVAVLDTGIDPATPSGAAANGVDRVRWDHGRDLDALTTGPAGSGLASEAGHGSFIVALVHRLVEGHVPMAAVRVLDADGLGSEQALVEALQRLRTLVDPLPRIINLSLGGFTDDGGWLTDDEDERELLFPISQRDLMPLGLGAELAKWTSPPFSETVFVCAAGNDGVDRPFWPAAGANPDDPSAVPVIVSVASLTETGTPSTFSNRGDWVCVCTTGESVLSAYSEGEMRDDNGAVVTFPSGGGAAWSGTSFAAPVIAAELARRCRDDGQTGAAAWAALAATLAPRVPPAPGMGKPYDALAERGVHVSG